MASLLDLAKRGGIGVGHHSQWMVPEEVRLWADNHRVLDATVMVASTLSGSGLNGSTITSWPAPNLEVEEWIWVEMRHGPLFRAEASRWPASDPRHSLVRELRQDGWDACYLWKPLPDLLCAAYLAGRPGAGVRMAPYRLGMLVDENSRIYKWKLDAWPYPELEEDDPDGRLKLVVERLISNAAIHVLALLKLREDGIAICKPKVHSERYARAYRRRHRVNLTPVDEMQLANPATTAKEIHQALHFVKAHTKTYTDKPLFGIPGLVGDFHIPEHWAGNPALGIHAPFEL